MANNIYDIYKSAGILIKDKKILVERSKGKDFFISPGGSIEGNETSKQTLIRELKEEFQIEVEISDLDFFGTFTAQAAGQNDKSLIMDVFLVTKWKGEPTPDNEVEEMLWIDSNIPDGIKVGSIFEHDVIPKLKKMGLIS